MAGKKGLLLGAIFLVIIVGLLFLTDDHEPLVVGFVAGQTGRVADLGIDCRRGAELAVNRANRQGGVDGRQIILDDRDDKNDPVEARRVVTELLGKKLPVIIGHATSAMTMATIDLMNSSETLLLSPTTSTPLLSDLDDNFFRVCTTSTAAASLLGRYLREVRQVKRAVVIYDLANREYSEHWSHSFRETFLEAGGESVKVLNFTSAPDVLLLPLVEEARSYDAEVMVIVANSLDAAMLAQQVKKSGWQVQLVLADWAATERLIELGGEAVEGAITSQFFNRESSQPAYQEFRAEFSQLYKTEPGFGAMHSYNATTMVLRALEQQQAGESLKQAILRLSTFPGLQKDITINSYGDSNHPTFIGVINRGAFQVLEDFR